MNIIVYGINGRMGRVLLAAAEKDNTVKIIAGIDKSEQKSSVPVYHDLTEFSGKADVIIDFSKPDAFHDIAVYCSVNKTPLVIASTGHNETQQKSIHTLSKSVPVFMASNMSVGVYLLNELVKSAAKTLGDSCEIEIVEKHHNRKADAPSGTALTLAKNINLMYGNSKVFTYGRSPESGKRQFNELCIHALRGGTITGEHEVNFICNDEVITLSHIAQSPLIFAHGALRAAKFVAKQKSGHLYGMTDLFN